MVTGHEDLGVCQEPSLQGKLSGLAKPSLSPMLDVIDIYFFKKNQPGCTIPGGSLFQWPPFHLGKEEMKLGCNQVDISGSCQRTPLTWKLQELFSEDKV